MTPAELVDHYYNLKSNQEITKSEIKAELANEHGYNQEEIKAVLIEISNRELYDLENKKSAVETFLGSIAVSYFFLIFGLIVIGVSLFILYADITTALNKTLPLILICGAIFMIFKHGKLIFQHRNQK